MNRNRVAVSHGMRVSRVSRRLGVAAATTGAAVLLAVAAAGGTYALWNTASSATPGSITTGSTGLTINDSTNYAITGLDLTGLYPGRSVITAAPLTVKNTGTTPLSVSAGTVTFTDPSGALAPQLVVAIRQASSCAPTAFGSTPTSLSAVTLQPGTTTTVCVEVQLKSTAPASVQGLSVGFTIPLVGTQVRP